MSVYQIGTKYWVNFRFNRLRHRKPSPDNTLKGARAYELHLRGKLARGEPLFEQEKNKAPLFKDFADKWQKTYVLTNNKPSEQAQKKCMLEKHLSPYFGKTALNEISALQIEEFKSKKQLEGLCNKSINNVLGILGKCLRTAQDWEVIDKLPKMKPLRVAPKNVKYLNEEEYTRLLAAADDGGVMYEMLLFAFRTGVRIGELTALEWQDIDLNHGNVTIQRNIVNGIIGSPKNNKFRTICLAQDIFEKLSSRKKTSGIVFPNKDNNHFSRFTCRDYLDRMCHKAGVKRISYHSTRHSFASQLATNGVSDKTIQELLGVSDFKMVQRYAHLQPVTLREAIKTLEPGRTINLNCGHYMVTVPELTPIKTDKVEI